MCSLLWSIFRGAECEQLTVFKSAVSLHSSTSQLEFNIAPLLAFAGCVQALAGQRDGLEHLMRIVKKDKQDLEVRWIGEIIEMPPQICANT